MFLYFNQSIKPLELNGPFWYIKRTQMHWPQLTQELVCDPPPHTESTRQERITLAGQLVIIIALNWRRGKSATSANNEVTKTKKAEVSERKKKKKRLVWYTECESLHECGSLHRCSDLGLPVNFSLDRMPCDYPTGTLLDWKQLNDILLLRSG